MASLLSSISGLVSGAIAALAPSASTGAATTASRPELESERPAPTSSAGPPTLLVKVIYATTTGTAARYAETLRREAFAMNLSGFHLEVTRVNAATYDFETSLEKESLLVFLMPTWEGGVPPASATMLCEYIREMATDFRVSKDALSKLTFAVFGLGSSEYAHQKNFCRAAIELDSNLRALGAKRLIPIGKGDDSSDMDATFLQWRQQGLWPALCEMYAEAFGGEEDDGDDESNGTRGCGPSGCGTAGADSDTKGLRSKLTGSKGNNDASGGSAAGFYDEDEVDDDGDNEFGTTTAKSSPGGGCCKDSNTADEDDGGCCGGGGDSSEGDCGCKPSSAKESGSNTAAATAGAAEGLSKKQRKYLERQAKEASSSTFVPAKEFRKMKKQMTEEERKAFEATRRAMALAAAGVSPAVVAAKATTGTSSTASVGGGAGSKAVRFSDGDDEEDEEEPVEEDEEDKINEALLALEPEDYDASNSSSGKKQNKASSSCGSATTVADSGSSSSGNNTSSLEDMEDLGAAMHRAAVERAAEAEALAKGAPRDMLTPAQRRALTKEGYQLIGSHSAVKICRWVKASLRGRGYCYKNAAYGIVSYLCIEATPSLACANKCVFCWRKLKNPVGREWRWKVDEPEMIVEAAVSKHVAQIKTLKGLPGIKMERWKEAFTPRHCALSLVGEPIFYPKIAELVKLLHQRKISTFLVTNAQFPDCMRLLPPVTQLYVSIDAATRDTLKAIDRPLFADFWERFLSSLDQLRERKQRSVYRLTLVKGKDDDVEALSRSEPSSGTAGAATILTTATDSSTAASLALAAAVAEKSSTRSRPTNNGGSEGNMKDLDQYAELIARGEPDFVEIKGVTWCGSSPGSNLTMANVPFHHEVKAFCEALCERLNGEYGLAVEHAHSCLVVLAKKDPFFVVNPEGRATTTAPRKASTAADATSEPPAELLRGDWWTLTDGKKLVKDSRPVTTWLAPLTGLFTAVARLALLRRKCVTITAPRW
jgi:wyosine [tRNA(Phe)-imidazoG37] synthetase (radical SAM superfamily)/flavodoxin